MPIHGKFSQCLEGIILFKIIKSEKRLYQLSSHIFIRHETAGKINKITIYNAACQVLCC